ncbi:hypothetical protein [Georgenia sp. SYP-B2076]|uniref:hypothetical protein n=1 Tax=Georgenia sp. SYP-B2076 TaxID=2495881 RepID=UPI000F8EA28C|nr:hypothetical protein [Georgenia sp. SYP-B2076]
MQAVTVGLLGAAAVALWRPAPPPPPPATDAVSPVVLPAPAPYTGGSTGCVVTDPTGTGGCVTGAADWLVSELGVAVGRQPMTCWSEHAWNPASDHRRGRGCDVFVGAAGQFPAAADVDSGWSMAEWFRLHADDLRVSYVIWQGKIWVADRADEGWAPYDGGGVYDAQDATGGHYDHIHVSVHG